MTVYQFLLWEAVGYEKTPNPDKLSEKKASEYRDYAMIAMNQEMQMLELRTEVRSLKAALGGPVNLTKAA